MGDGWVARAERDATLLALPYAGVVGKTLGEVVIKVYSDLRYDSFDDLFTGRV